MRWRTSLVLLVALSLAAAPARAQDDADTEVAKRLFKKASSVYIEGDYEQALALFERARVAKPLPAFDFNIALCFDRLGRWPEALAAYERVATTTSDPSTLKEAKERIPILRDRVKVTVHRNTAEEHYKKAVVHFNNDAYLPAAEEFKLAYQAVPDPLYLYNTGQAYRLANDTVNATHYFEELLRTAPDSPQRSVVEMRLRELKAGPGSAANKPKVTIGPGTASERLKPIAELIKSKRAGFRACFDAWGEKHPRVGGQVLLSFFIDPDGVINQPSADAKGFEAPEVTACIVKFALTLAYPAASNGKYTRFNYPFDFKPN